VSSAKAFYELAPGFGQRELGDTRVAVQIIRTT